MKNEKQKRQRIQYYIWRQVTWIIIIMAIILPLSYLWGRHHGMAGNDSLASSLFDQKLPQRTIIEIPTIVRQNIAPFGETKVESSSFNGRGVWLCTYEKDDDITKDYLFSQIQKEWRLGGLDVLNGQNEIMGNDINRDYIFLASFDPSSRKQNIYCLENTSKNRIDENPMKIFQDNNLPQPPHDAIIVDYSTDSRGIFGFTTETSWEVCYHDYTNSLKSGGWIELEKERNTKYFSILKNKDQVMTVSSSRTPDEKTMILITVF
mgnify:CR=1 FL=1